MKSIRLSLMICFLGLLAVALLASSLLVYGNAEQTSEAERQAMEQLIQTRYEERCRREEAKLDADLLAQAQSLAQLVQVQTERYWTSLVRLRQPRLRRLRPRHRLNRFRFQRRPLRRRRRSSTLCGGGGIGRRTSLRC